MRCKKHGCEYISVGAICPECENEKIMKSAEEIDKEIAGWIKYPAEWDTMAYPTLASALWELSQRRGNEGKNK